MKMKLSQKDADMVFGYLDQSNDGSLNYQEFSKLYEGATLGMDY